jgi:hypothetical protein
MADQYYIANNNIYNDTPSHLQAWVPQGGMVNKLSPDDVRIVVDSWLASGTLKRVPRTGDGKREDLPPWGQDSNYSIYFKTDLVPTKKNGHPQGTIGVSAIAKFSPAAKQYFEGNNSQVKVLVHEVVWRFLNNGATLPSGLDISHCDHDGKVLNLIAESTSLNESRKYCKQMGWYGRNDNNGTLLCPHRNYKRCT